VSRILVVEDERLIRWSLGQRLEQDGHRVPRCPVILMTARGGPDLFREAEKRGAFRILEKPFGLDTLVDLVEEALHPGA
jgi:DNA-binding NtrC family response regulator